MIAQRVAINIDDLVWEDSPAKGVTRKKLDRQDAEQGKATSVVRYAPGSAFATHQHPGGEEIFVLEGVFSDEHGDYPALYWLRSPHLSKHTPFA